MKNPQVVVGIDNGVSGGLVALSGFDGAVIDYRQMPVTTVAGKSEVYVKGVLYWLDQFSPESTVVVLEEPLKHAKSSQAMRSMSISFGKVLGVCETVGYPTYRMQVKEWQDVELGKKLAKGQTKSAALAKAQQHWPDESWLATSRSRVPHDGIIDAALIARNFIHCKT